MRNIILFCPVSLGYINLYELFKMSASGYSGTTLAKKLGIQSAYILKLINEPEYYFSLFTDFPDDARISHDLKEKKNLIHYFTKNKDELAYKLPALKKEIFPEGMIWVSWPKKTSKVSTDLTEDVIRHLALQAGLVDVKVCAIDEIWSALKLVIPLKERK